MVIEFKKQQGMLYETEQGVERSSWCSHCLGHSKDFRKPSEGFNQGVSGKRMVLYTMVLYTKELILLQDNLKDKL